MGGQILRPHMRRGENHRRYPTHSRGDETGTGARTCGKRGKSASSSPTQRIFFSLQRGLLPSNSRSQKKLVFFFLSSSQATHTVGGLDLPREPYLYVPNLFFFTSSIPELCCECGLHTRAQAGERVPVVKTWLRRSLLAFAGLASSSLPCLIGMSEKVRPFGRFGGFPFMQGCTE